MAWARQAGAERLDLLVEDCAGLLARRAGEFDDPPAVWWVQGRELHPVEPAAVDEPVLVDEADVDLAASLRDAGADVVVEHGVVSGEVLGLEVARVVDGRIEVGVGRHDREAFAMIHGDLPPAEALATVVDAVRGQPPPGRRRSPAHAAGAGAMAARRRAPATRAGRRRRARAPRGAPAAAERQGHVAVARRGGQPGASVVACSVGIDLDLVPYAADARLAVDPDARLVLVVPERDAHPVTRALAERLRRPAEVVAVAGRLAGAP